MKRFLDFLNPMVFLGIKKYSLAFPLLANLLIVLLSEFYAYYMAGNPLSVGNYIIVVNIASIIYFSFRDGIKGGIISSFAAILYYFYIIFSRQYTGSQFSSGVVMTLGLGLVYFSIAGIIGWLKQRIDALIITEADERQRLTGIISELPVGVLITDSNGVIQQTNKKLKNILGPGLSIRIKEGKILTDKTAPSIYRALNDEKGIRRKMLTVKRADGTPVHLHLSTSLIKNKRGHITASASIFSDITREVEMENRKDDFINIASHELKTPLTSLKAYSQIVSRRLAQSGDTVTRSMIKSLDRQINRITMLVGDMLDVAKIKSKKLILPKEKFDMKVLIEETVRDFKTIYGGRIKIRVRGDLKKPVLADRFRIGQVLSNLLTNAIKYSPDSDKIIIELADLPRRVRISVRDFGIGITPDEHKQLFKPYFQAKAARDQEGRLSSLGLGLFISHEIIKDHHGRLWADSRPGKGSVFYFTLPA